MPLTFRGLELRKQLALLSSVNSELNLKKISQALRIQCPRPRTNLCCVATSWDAAVKGKGRGRSIGHANFGDEDATAEDGDACYEDIGTERPSLRRSIYMDFADNDDAQTIDALIQDFDYEGGVRPKGGEQRLQCERKLWNRFAL